MKNKRLGKGLEALIPQMTPEEESARKDALFEVEIAKIKANPLQPRLEFDRNRLEELKKSITENGLIQPITVRKTTLGFELIAGERRLRAVQELGFFKIPAFIVQVDSDDQMLEMALVENIQRENLNPIELAKAYEQLQKEYGLTQEQVAAKVGKDRATISNFIRLLKLPDQVQGSLQAGEIDMGHARALMGLESRGDQIKVWKKCVQGGWSVRQVEKAVRAFGQSSESAIKSKKGSASPFLIEAEDRIRSVLGTQVRVSSSKKGGKIEITYYSEDDLERLLELLESVRESYG